MSADGKVSKVIRDPIHDLIRIEDQFILDLLDAAAVQRLRRIRQLGMAFLVYPGAEHSRFAHSLGVYHLAGRAIEQLQRVGGRNLFSKERRNALLAAALLHDIGHGPFSHVFERITGQKHERWTDKIVRCDHEINAILRSVSCQLPDDICSVLNGTYRPHYVPALISSQLDVDRFDYLLRDAHMTGAQYGRFDLEWMLRTLAVQEVSPNNLQTIVVDGRRGISGLEAYLLGRHYMYQHVYYHKTIRAAEVMLEAIVRRAISLQRNGCHVSSSSVFAKIATKQPLSVTDYLGLDDFVVMDWIRQWSDAAQDDTLRCLSTCLMQRKLLKPIVIEAGRSIEKNMAMHQKLQDLACSKGYDPEYYVVIDQVRDIAYRDYLAALEKGHGADEEKIWFVDDKGSFRMLSSQRSSVVVQAISALKYQEERWYAPAEVAVAVREQVNPIE